MRGGSVSRGRRSADYDDPEFARHREAQADDLPLFMRDAPLPPAAPVTPPRATASIEAGRAALTATASKHQADIERLRPLALELARKAPEITVSDLRLYAVQRGLLTGQENGRELSWLGAVMAAAGLEPTGSWVRSKILKSHGNLHQTYRLPTPRSEERSA